MKSRMKLISVLGIAVLLVAAFSFATGAQAQTGTTAQTTTPPTTSTDRTVSVTGVGQIDVQPDKAILSLGVQTQATDATSALSQNSQQMTAVVSALTAAGVASTDMRTLTVSLVPQYQQPATNTETNPAIIGYIATNTVQVTTKDLAKLGALLDAASKAGANQISGITFDLSNPAAALDQARQAAWQDAQHRASQLAQLAGVQLGSVMTIAEATPTPPRPFAEFVAPAAAGSGVPVSSGTISIEVDISVTWAIQ